MARPPVASPRDVPAVLREVLADVNQWLHFAEAKNGALLAISAALIVAGLDRLPELGTLAVMLQWAIPICMTLLIASMLLASVSFFPRLVPYPDAATDSAHGNLLYFRTAADMGPSLYLDSVDARFGPIVSADNHLCTDLAQQICANSQITVKKLSLFKWASLIFILGLVILAGGVFWSVVEKLVSLICGT